jgi:hypothetical protein
MMIATTMNAAISERARSSVFDRGAAAAVSSRRNDNFLWLPLLPGPAFFRKDQPMAVRNASKQASVFERVGSLRTGRHPARFLKGIHRACILAAAVSRGFLLHVHILVWRLTKILRKRDQPSFYFDVTGHKRKLAALLDFIA